MRNELPANQSPAHENPASGVARDAIQGAPKLDPVVPLFAIVPKWHYDSVKDLIIQVNHIEFLSPNQVKP